MSKVLISEITDGASLDGGKSLHYHRLEYHQLDHQSQFV